MAGRFTLPTPSAYDSSGKPLAGGKLEFYESGTSTPLDTYSDDDLSTANANPVVADSAGRWGDIFLKDQDYKVILKSSADVTIDTWDPVRAAEPTSTATRSISTTTTQGASDNGKLILCDATSGAFTYTLLPAATAGDGFTVYVKKVDSSSNAVTVDADGSETVDGGTDVSLPNQWDVVGLRCNGTAWRVLSAPLTADSIPLPRGYIDGLVLSNNGTDAEHDLDIAAGVARDGDDEANMTLSSAITKRIDAAWAVGDGNGGLDTGSVTTDTLYAVWLIRRSDTGVVDVLFSTSFSAPTMPTNYDQKRYIGAVKTDASSNILPFKQRKGGFFEYVTPIADVEDSAPTSSDAGEEYTLSVPPSTRARFIVHVNDNSATALAYVRPTDMTDDTPVFNDVPYFTAGFSGGGMTSVYASATVDMWVDASRQISGSVSSGAAELSILTLGWWDPRGRDS